MQLYIVVTSFIKPILTVKSHSPVLITVSGSEVTYSTVDASVISEDTHKCIQIFSFMFDVIAVMLGGNLGAHRQMKNSTLSVVMNLS